MDNHTPTPQRTPTIDDLVMIMLDTRKAVGRIETRLCKLIEHQGAIHLIHQPKAHAAHKEQK